MPYLGAEPDPRTKIELACPIIYRMASAAGVAL